MFADGGLGEPTCRSIVARMRRLIFFFVIHVVVWTGLILIIPGDDRVGFDRLGLGATPWVRQFHIALIVVLAVQVVYITRRGWWRSVMFDEARSTSPWLLVLPFFVLVLAGAQFVQDGLSDAPRAYWIGMTVTMVLVGITEELTFRGILVVGARETFGSERSVLVTSSVLFGLFHLPNWLLGQDGVTTLRQVVTTALMGAVFYGLRRGSRTLIACIVLHAMYDWLLIQGAFI